MSTTPTTKSKGGRTPTGAVIWKNGVWHARVTLPCGTRKSIPMQRPELSFGPVGSPEHSAAKRMALLVSRRTRDVGAATAEAGESVNEWFARWVDVREKRGLRSARCDKGRYEKWVAPHIGTIAMTAVNRSHIERVVQRLDEAVQRNEIRWKTAGNTWGVITKMFKDSCRSKVLELRVRDDNPARDVQGPDRGEDRASPYLYPAEFIRLVSDERVPLRWRRFFTLAIYLYVRGGELAALQWEDVDFARGYVHVHRSLNTDTGKVGATKTKDTRKVPIERTLMPLLRGMHAESVGRGEVFEPSPHPSEWASQLRHYLKLAGVARADLFANDLTRRWIDFHDLRHSGITWRAVRGDEPLKIMRAGGHDDLRTTMIYVNEAQTFDEDFGTTFPNLPTGLGGVSDPVVDPAETDSAKYAEKHTKAASPEGVETPCFAAKKLQTDVDIDEAPKAIGIVSGDTESPQRTSHVDTVDPIEGALADALGKAAAAGRYDVVAQLAGELQARRMARAGDVVVSIADARVKRGR